MPSAKKPAAKSTAVATRASGAVVSVKDMIAAQIAKNANKTEPATGNKIRVTQSKEMVLPDGTKTRDPIQVVVVDFCSRNTFYPHTFDKDNPTPPACFAIGEEPKKLVPSDNSPEKQCDEGCASCPNNAWGSAPNGKGGKACKNTRLLAVLPPDADESTEIWLLETSPTANKGFDGYINGLGNRMTMAPFQVVTTVSLDEASDYPTLMFSDPEPLPDDKVAIFADRIEDAQKLLATEPDVSGYGQQPSKPAARGKAQPAAKAAGRVAVARR